MNDFLTKFLGQKLFKSLLSVKTPRLAFRFMLVSMIIVVLAFVMLGFAILHLFYTHDYQLSIASSIAFLVLTVAFLYLRQSQNIGITGHFSSIAVVIFFPIYAQLNQNDQFGLIWLLVLPFLVIAFNGFKIGLGYIAFYLIIVVSMAYLNIGVWEDGDWTELSVIRLLIGLLVFTALATMLDIANNHLNIRIEKQRRKEDVYLSKLKMLSTVDSLTSLYNRHYFNEVVEQKVEELKDSDLYLTFFILDIDHFKLYNDHFGHQKGDEALQKIASEVSLYMKRQNDLVFRLGGEEFAGLLVSDSPQEISQWLSQLTKKVKDLKIAHSPEAPEKYLTISLGIFSSKVSDLSAINCLYKIADKALYKAKHQGRNQSVIAEPNTHIKECV